MPTPEIVAHRGASRERPENTLAAFRRAVELGADATELDIHRTQDGVLIVHHDPKIAGIGAIRELGWHIVRDARVRGEPIPALSDVFDAVGGSLRVYCELKGVDTAADTVALIAAKGIPADRTAVHSFDHRLVAQAGRLAPRIPRGVLEVSYPVEPLSAAKPVAARDLWRQWEFIDAEFVEAVHAAGCRVVAWTVNDAAVMERFALLGVDALCTDDVGLAKRVLSA
ncbi:MAG: glycerophosphodiester phosphodiesterase [Gemmatimonadaceae bacterium]